MLIAAFLCVIFVIIIFIILLSENSQLSIKKIDYVSEEHKFFIRKTRKNILLLDNESLNVYFNIPENSVYWSIGFFSEGRCIRTVNMAEYLNFETGDIVHVLITRNARLINPSIDLIEKRHNDVHPYNKLLTKILNIKEKKIDIKYEVFFLKNTEEFSLKIFKFSMTNTMMEEFSDEVHEPNSYSAKENLSLYLENISVPSEVKIHRRISQTFCECLSYISEPFIPTKNFRIFAVNHYKTKAALNSHILVLSFKTKEIIKFFYTGIISKNILMTDRMEIRDISFPIDEKIILIENIYLYQCVSKINVEDIIPMRILS